ncbi:MAG: YlbF/YmcA family competence regulator [Planctomycetota bacterium]|jgi:cell fate (sporulation/competence/biofilm development) regulator YlbF (YheA/YmcA/DUF963 family)
MQEILDNAKRLAESIAKSERYMALRDAEQAVKKDEEAGKLLGEFNAKTLAILEKEHKLQPVEPEDKRELATLKERVAGNALLQALNKAQADYSEMMDQVNRTLFEKLEVR